MQCPCGDRLCGLCFDSFKARYFFSNSTKLACPLCKSEILLEDCFRDRAATVELRKATLQCTSPGCSWEGPSDKNQDHTQSCGYKIIVCPHNMYGCKKVLQRSEMDVHQVKCEYKPVRCKWCGDDVMDLEAHKKDCQMVPQYCGNGCGELIPRKDVEKHMRTICPHQVRDCDYQEDVCPFMIGHKKVLRAWSKGLFKDCDLYEKYKCPGCNSLLRNAVQTIICGHLYCEDCIVQLLKTRNPSCSVCQQSLEEDEAGKCYFPDKYVRQDIQAMEMNCMHKSAGCTWNGIVGKYEEHLQTCKFFVTQCPYEKYGCKEELTNAEMAGHAASCDYMPVQCTWCNDSMPEEKMEEHLEMYCAHYDRRCKYQSDGCEFIGNFEVLKEHYLKCWDYHQVMQRLRYLERDLKLMLNQTQQVLTMTELEVQELQAKSYNGVYIWKIEDVQRCCCEARSSETCFLFSEPFYTGRYGYKVCLRLYMNGDGVGKGTHLSLYLVVMKGDNDNILSWPFDKKVSVMILNQRSGPDVIQSLQPDRTIQRPQNSDMNIASGCPQFAPLALLDDPSYVKCDTMYIKVKVEKIKTLTITLDLD